MDTPKTWYVYLLCDPDTEQPFYVGKGTGERMHTHEKTLNTRYDSNDLKKEIIRKILAQGKQVLKRKVAEFDDEKEAYAYEVALIKQYGDRLTNLKPGGGKLYSQVTSKPKIKSQHPDKEWLSLEDAAKAMGIQRSTIYYYLKDLGIEGRKFGRDRKRYISLAEVEKLKDYKAHPWKYAKQGESSEEAA